MADRTYKFEVYVNIFLEKRNIYFNINLQSKKLQVGTIEMLGPGGFLVILEYESDNICEMRHQIKVICRKNR